MVIIIELKDEIRSQVFSVWVQLKIVNETDASRSTYSMNLMLYMSLPFLWKYVFLSVFLSYNNFTKKKILFHFYKSKRKQIVQL